MSTKDLMIGDWIRIKFHNREAKVTAIHGKLIDTTSVSPLTKYS